MKPANSSLSINSIAPQLQNGFRKGVRKNIMATKLFIARAIIINGPIPELNWLKLGFIIQLNFYNSRPMKEAPQTKDNDITTA